LASALTAASKNAYIYSNVSKNKNMKKTGIISFAIGSIIFLSNLLNINVITQSVVVESLANATGGIPSDILGGFGCIFFFVSLLLFLVNYKKKKDNMSKWLMISSIILGLANFYFAFSPVI
jgi:formate-dependent nitrite reductase membrane component NrfD